MTQKRLDDPNIGAALKQVDREAVPQRMQRHALLLPKRKLVRLEGRDSSFQTGASNHALELIDYEWGRHQATPKRGSAGA